MVLKEIIENYLEKIDKYGETLLLGVVPVEQKVDCQQNKHDDCLPIVLTVTDIYRKTWPR